MPCIVTQSVPLLRACLKKRPRMWTGNDGMSSSRLARCKNVILNSANVSIIATDEKGIVHFFCVGAEHMLGFQPDVIVMDINLPGISGVEALRVLRADPLTAWIPAIAVSANAMPHNIEKGPAAGFFNCLTKPIKVGQFMSALDLALSRSEHAVRLPVEAASA